VTDQAPVSAQARRWVEASLGPGAHVVSARRLRGGLSSVVHKLTVERDGQRFSVVLKRPETEEGEPGDASLEVAQEALILRRLTSLPAPRLIAVDPSGEASGSPAILQTLLPGRPHVAPKAVGSWLQGLSTATRTIATAEISASDLDSFAPWLPPSDQVPQWCSAQIRWEDTMTRLRTGLFPETSGQPQFVHRDLHPANVLMSGQRFAGIVDWVNGCRAPIEVDVSRCRVEIAILAGMAAANAYLDLCTDFLPAYDHRWDALVAIELSPWVEDLVECFNGMGAKLTATSVAETLDNFVIG
jgi:aminoglycoside phosphotransferase (APT) family kinase protein